MGDNDRRALSMNMGLLEGTGDRSYLKWVGMQMLDATSSKVHTVCTVTWVQHFITQLYLLCRVTDRFSGRDSQSYAPSRGSEL